METTPDNKEVVEITPKGTTENLSPQGISSMQGVEATVPQPDAGKAEAGKAEAGKAAAETPVKPDTTTPPEFQPTPMLGENQEKGTADGVETGAEKKRDYIPAYGSGGPERGG